MKKDNSKKYIIFLIGFIVGILGFTISFIMYKKEDDIIELPKEEILGDLVFSSISKSVYVKDIIPTLDKFGVMNEPFSFTIKNNSNLKKKYQVILSDDNSTIKNSSIRYELTRNNQVIGIFTLSDDAVIDVDYISPNSEISYSIKLWIDYNSEIKVGNLSKRITIEELEENEEKVNNPVLVDGMIPVYYDNNTNSWYKGDIENPYNNEWYNYNKQKWANAITVNSEKRNFYLESNIGTKIDMNDVNAMFVWIPRFSYEINNDNINIHFVNIDEKAYTAFNFNGRELNGFWITKFESGLKEDSSCIISSLTKECNHLNNSLYFVPNYPFANRLSMANMFYSIRKMELKNNIYGFMASGDKVNDDGTIKNDDNNIDIHMIKNSEWQAVALLSDSQYGKKNNSDYQEENKMIYHNNSNYLGKSFYQDETFDYNALLKGTGASTTGNITGVYDMSGGKREFVMLNTDELNIFNKNSNSGFKTSVQDYYYDVNSLDSDTTLLLKDRYSKDNKITKEIITRGGYRNTGSIFNVYSVNDFINKISLESNSRACIVIDKENENEEEKES